MMHKLENFIFTVASIVWTLAIVMTLIAVTLMFWQAFVEVNSCNPQWWSFGQVCVGDKGMQWTNNVPTWLINR